MLNSLRPLNIGASTPKKCRVRRVRKAQSSLFAGCSLVKASKTSTDRSLAKAQRKPMTDTPIADTSKPQIVPFEKPATKGEAGRPRVLAIANQKGGVGKTTTAINLGTALAAIGEHVLIVDLDPQGNASTGLGIERRARRTSTYDVLTGAAPMREAVVPTAVPQLFIAPSTLDLSGLELEIGQARDRAFRLRSALNAINSGDRSYDFSYVLVDCPP